MSGTAIRIIDAQGQTHDLSTSQFLEYYRSAPLNTINSRSVQAQTFPLTVDMNWYMNEGPGRYFDPSQFEVVRQVLGRTNLAPGSYSLDEFVTKTNDISSNINKLDQYSLIQHHQIFKVVPSYGAKPAPGLQAQSRLTITECRLDPI